MISYSPNNVKLWSRLGSNGAFGIAALELPAINAATVLLTADLSHYSGCERFRKNFPEKFYNLGISEQNMVGVAAGMAKEGLKPFVTTYASFATTRCLDQVRVNMGYMKLPINLIGLTSGFAVGILGATHIGIEDISIIRSIPNITIISPADSTETVKAVLEIANYAQPVYLRLTGGIPNPIVYREDYTFKIGKAIELMKGDDVCIIATGSMVYYALNAAKQLEKLGISCKVINMHTIKPLDEEAIISSLTSHLLVTIEEHSIYGGLGGAVAELLSGKTNKPPQLIIGIRDEYPHAGSYDFLLNQYELSTEAIVLKIQNKLSI